MTKKHIFSIAIGLICLVAGILLLNFVVPEKIPLMLGFDERIVYLGNKWWLTILCAMPLVLAILQILLCKKCGTFIFQFLIALLLYENVLIFIYLCLSEGFNVGDIFPLPLSLLIFLPLAFSVMVRAIKIKFVPYKSKLGINIKYTLKTEFIWKQTHYIARDMFFFGGFLLCICSIIFAFFHVTWIEISIFVAVLAICFIRVVLYSKSMYDKLCEMEKNKENLEKSKKTE